MKPWPVAQLLKHLSFDLKNKSFAASELPLLVLSLICSYVRWKMFQTVERCSYCHQSLFSSLRFYLRNGSRVVEKYDDPVRGERVLIQDLWCQRGVRLAAGRISHIGFSTCSDKSISTVKIWRFISGLKFFFLLFFALKCTSDKLIWKFLPYFVLNLALFAICHF